MFQTIGVDEAGYGPNLGPLVIATTVWELPEDARQCDMRELLDDVIYEWSDEPNGRLMIADSKRVYSPRRGFARLELAVLSILRTMGIEPDTLRELWLELAAPDCSLPDEEPWFTEYPIKLPYAAKREDILETTDRLNNAFQSTGVIPRTIKLDVVLVERYNKLIAEIGKGQCLSRSSMNLLRSVWDPADAAAKPFIVCDKHGGRNKYADLVAAIIDDRMLFTVEESDAVSHYRVGHSDLYFRTKAESFMPVALASMFAKYVRELSMHAFNAFWQDRVDDLSPTKGYPQDARRFHKDIEEQQKKLGISDDILWRTK